ncbi:hypothetical protein J5X84_44655 [Streptosporangiaceae bacterium NEAU-GS5]|nr:hypothetical protein [Streptosporangiaceae bacterium NEAU-GS5]
MRQQVADGDTTGGFYARIRELYETARRPSLRHIAAKAYCGKTTVSKLLNGQGIPERETTLKIIESLGGCREEWYVQVDEARAAQGRIQRTKGRGLRDQHHLPLIASTDVVGRAPALAATREKIAPFKAAATTEVEWLRSCGVVA